MTLHLTTRDAWECSALLTAVQAVARKAEAAAQTHDTEDAKRLLGEVWNLTHRAMTAIMDAEQRAREAAIEASNARHTARIHYLEQLFGEQP